MTVIRGYFGFGKKIRKFDSLHFVHWTFLCEQTQTWGWLGEAPLCEAFFTGFVSVEMFRNCFFLQSLVRPCATFCSVLVTQDTSSESDFEEILSLFFLFVEQNSHTICS